MAPLTNPAPATTTFIDSGGVRVEKVDPPVGFTMSEKDWNRFGRYLKGLSDLPGWARDAFILFLGIGLGGLVPVISWLAELAQTAEPSVGFMVSGVAWIIVTLGAFVIAIVSRLMDSGLRRKLRRDADLLYEDMDHVHRFEEDFSESGPRGFPMPTAEDYEGPDWGASWSKIP